MDSRDKDEALLSSLEKRLESDPWWRYLGIEIEEAADGSSRLRLRKTARVTGPPSGAIREGVVACLVEAAARAAIDSLDTPTKRDRATVNIALSLLSRATQDIVSEARVLLAGDVAAKAEVEVRDASGELIAAGMVVCAATMA